tara:strand:- start:10422 stop:12308 length:1887 start_codon:yes stop_codon:yes gene_type:complete
MNPTLKRIVGWLVMAAIIWFVYSYFSDKDEPTEISYTTFTSMVSSGEVKSVVISGATIELKTQNGAAMVTNIPYALESGNTMALLQKHNVNVKALPPGTQSGFSKFLWSFGPVILLILAFIFIMGARSGGIQKFAKSPAKHVDPKDIKVRFSDVAGCDDAKDDVMEVVDYLKDPKKPAQLGAKAPKGILLVGPPGTGKTLLAKAIAGEAKVPFFTISGSDFVEMLVGVGASRVRDMFTNIKKEVETQKVSGAILFIDEIDAVGRKRGGGHGGGHDEREQTLNQLLVEMDGFASDSGITVIAATNQPEVLDPALLRPGRFDRQVTVNLPDVKGREDILNVHIQNVPYDETVSTRDLARGTPGFSGADLANLVNEAALVAVRANAQLVTAEHFGQAADKIMLGPERRSLVMSKEEIRNTSYHEIGHALIGKIGYLQGVHDPVYKVSVIARGRALGLTYFLPEGDRTSYSLNQLIAMVDSLLAGRCAEYILAGESIGDITTGASNDLERATEILKQIATKWGFSQTLGLKVVKESQAISMFLGGSEQGGNMSPETEYKLEQEIKAWLADREAYVIKTLKKHWEDVEKASEKLIKKETLDDAELAEIWSDIIDEYSDKPFQTPKPFDREINA